MALTIHGFVAPGFEPVADAFRTNFTERDEVGAAVSATVKGEVVVDLWAGTADVDSHKPWQRDTMAVMFSATKGMVAAAFLMLEDRGEIDLDKPISYYWPEFRGGLRDLVTVRHLLNHRAGLSVVDAPLTLDQFATHEGWKQVEAALVAQEPTWIPGSRQAYGATAYGMYTQAIFKRITGQTVGAWLKAELFDPLELDLWLGLPASENHRVATLYPVAAGELVSTVIPKMMRGGTIESRVYRGALLDKTSISHRALLNPSFGPERLEAMNRPDVRAMELPWMNGIGTARGLARMYGALVDGTRIGRRSVVKKSTLAPVMRKQSWTNDDGTLRKPMGYSQGFIKEEPHLLSPFEAHFGHTGAGGTVGFADPTHDMGFAYLMNRMDHHIRSPRCIAVCRAMYESLEGWV